MSIAARLAAGGHPVFELSRGSKIPPAGSKWANGGATTDAMDAFDALSGRNYGVRCDRLIVLDLDEYKSGFNADSLGELPATFTVATARGGRHLYYGSPAGGHFASKIELAPGVDVRAGAASYVVGPGSRLDGRAYAIATDLPIAPAPKWLIDRLRAAPAKAPNAGQVVGELDTPAAIESARAWLESTAPLAVERRGGDATTIAVSNTVMDRGVSPEVCFDLLAQCWNDRCSPPWELDALETKVQNAAHYRQEAIGSKNPAAGFEAGSLPSQTRAIADVLEFAGDVNLAEIAAAEANAIVKGYLRPGESALIYGASTAGKTFVALDLAYHIAHGRDWHGRKVKRPRAVLYVALEGVRGFRRRVLAANATHGDPGKYFARLKLPISLVRGEAGSHGVALIAEAFSMLLRQVGETDGLVIIDTLARAMAGDDENSTADMAHFVEHRQGAIASATNAATLVVHHSNKQGAIRGNTSNFAAQDLVLRVDRDGDVRQVRAEKTKDGIEGPLFDFELGVVALGLDDDGDPMTSCVVKAAMPVERPVKLSAAQRALVTALDLVKTAAIDPETGEPVVGATEAQVQEKMRSLEPNKNTRNGHWHRLKHKDGLPPGIVLKSFGGVPHYVESLCDW